MFNRRDILKVLVWDFKNIFQKQITKLLLAFKAAFALRNVKRLIFLQNMPRGLIKYIARVSLMPGSSSIDYVQSLVLHQNYSH